MNQRTIVRARIHPAIGIARVGNSKELDDEGYFIGPEVLRAEPSGRRYKDRCGRLKRQAARFRIYGYDQDGAVVREIDGSEIVSWTAHLANKKAAWYRFDLALDLDEAVGTQSRRRNESVKGKDRDKLIIDPGSRTICGENSSGQYFDTGEFFGNRVDLGELRTDECGRLLVLGGRGVAATPFPGHSLGDFANNSGWYDDTSDGPVSAVVEIGGERVPVDPAWVVVAPPNFAPEVIAVQSLWDVVYDKMADGFIQPPAKPSFTRDILPILRQLCDTQWVNFGFFVQYGFRGPNEFVRPDYLEKLRCNCKQFAELRLQIASLFRDPGSKIVQPDLWPPIHGDVPAKLVASPRNFLAITKTRFGFLQQWAKGDFVADYDADAIPPKGIEDLPLAEQPFMLDRAALSYCAGGPFHPGYELTWPMRHSAIYRSPFRVRFRPQDLPEPDFGDFLTKDIAGSPDGPISFTGPGDLTRWMSVPWHTDAATCHGGGQNGGDQFIPTFWPGRLPNDVLTEEDYEYVIDKGNDLEERRRRFNLRHRWLRHLRLTDPFLDQIQHMARIFDQLGIVERRPGVDGFPDEMFVEMEVTNPDAHAPGLDIDTDNPTTAWTANEDFIRARFGGPR